MAEKEQNQFMQNLPPQIKAVIEDGAWLEKTAEIAKKYSLSENQSDKMSNIVALMIVGLQDPATFLETISSELNISKLLAEQIMEELNTRVFEYALKLVDDFEKKKSQPVQQTAKVEVKKQPLVPEIAPEILPVVEKNQPARMNEMKPSPKKVEMKKDLASAIASAVKPVVTKPEPIQKPFPVPRFTMAKIPEGQPAEIPPEKTLSAPVVKAHPALVPKVEPKPEPAKTSFTDPYREPTE